MQIVVLDGYTLNPGDLSWEGLTALGPCAIYDRTPPALVVERARDAEIALTNKVELTRPILEQLPQLKYVGVLATGYNVVDIAAARQRGVLVTNVPSYATKSVAQVALSHLLNLAVRVGPLSQGVAEGRWTRSLDFAYWDDPLIELDSLTAGIVGFGRIGRELAALCRALGMKVKAFSPRTPKNVPAGIAMVGLDELFRTSDVVSLHCPLTSETRQLVNAQRLATMKPTAFLINTGRGMLIDEAALADALNSGRIAGVGLDVLSTEPPHADNPLIRAKSCYITPHIAWATTAARRRLLDLAVKNVQAFLDHCPTNVVN
jgi:glycerate dehydrogenase